MKLFRIDDAGGFEIRKDAKPLLPADDPDKKYKLVTFVPPKDLEKVGDALYSAGAGVIGEYTHCSYQLRGMGTFFGKEGSNPTVGRRGRHESVDEVRLERGQVGDEDRGEHGHGRRDRRPLRHP
jgi:hypothetical protein